MGAPETTFAEVASRWGGHYKIGGSPQEGYGALRRDGSGSHIFAGTPGELDALLVADHAASHGPGER